MVACGDSQNTIHKVKFQSNIVTYMNDISSFYPIEKNDCNFVGSFSLRKYPFPMKFPRQSLVISVKYRMKNNEKTAKTISSSSRLWSNLRKVSHPSATQKILSFHWLRSLWMLLQPLRKVSQWKGKKSLRASLPHRLRKG